MSVSIIIVDDHLIFRQGLKEIIHLNPGFSVIGETDNGAHAIELVKKIKPNIVIMDIHLPDINGIEVTEKICSVSPCTKVIGLSVYHSKNIILNMLRAGASGYLTKECTSEQIINSIRTVLENRIYLSDNISNLFIKDSISLLAKKEKTAFSILSSREREILRMISEGHTTKEIAHALKISIKTVDVFRSKIMKKLCIYSIAELTKYAVREGITSL